MATPAAPVAPAIALTIAGSDSSGGAGIQADLKTFSAFGVYGASVVTALTAQNTLGVFAVCPVAPSCVLAQLEAVLSDLEVGAVKTGMLANASIIEAVAQRLGAAPGRPLIVDPVLAASRGEPLLAAAGVAVLKSKLLPLTTLLTPNRIEAAVLLDTEEAASEAEAVAQTRALRALGPAAVLLKGGHASGAMAVDFLCDDAGLHRFERPRLDTPHAHGTGCTLSAAIGALLALGVGLAPAVERAKRYVWEALQAGRTLAIGHGRGPVDPLFAIRSGRYPPA
jgi:hydroxymethylpyrimidine/phosphomethylpyrimidine kinase